MPLDWKLLAVVVAGLALFATGLAKELGVGDITDRFTEGFGIASAPESVTRNITVRGVFNPAPFSLDIPIKEFFVDYASADTAIFVNDGKLTANGTARVVIREFKGKASYDGAFLTFSGDAKSVSVDSIGIESSASLLKVRAQQLPVATAGFRDIDVRKLAFASLGGTLTLQDNIVVAMTGEPLVVENYLGNILLNGGNIVLDGKAKKVLVSGKDYKTTVS